MRLRAERSPRGDGRVYRIAFAASDAHGGECTGAATVAVPRTEPARGRLRAAELRLVHAEHARSTSISSMFIDVRLFAMLRERAGSDSVTVEVPEGATVRDAVDAVGASTGSPT